MEKPAEISPKNIKPMSWLGALLHFGLPTLLMVFGMYILMPALIRAGMTTYYAYILSLSIPLLLLVVAWVAYLAEGNPLKWRSFLGRFRYQRMTGRDWLWTAGIFAVEMLLYLLVARFSMTLVNQGIIPLPRNLPAFVDPHTFQKSPKPVRNTPTKKTRINAKIIHPSAAE
jgi:hypothetical protein